MSVLFYKDFETDCSNCKSVLKILKENNFEIEIKDIKLLDKSKDFDLDVMSQVCKQNMILPVINFNNSFIDITKEGWINELQKM